MLSSHVCRPLFCVALLIGTSVSGYAQAADREWPQPTQVTTSLAIAAALGDVAGLMVATDEPPVAAKDIAPAATKTAAKADALQARLDRVITMYGEKPYSTLQQNPWEVMHIVIGWGVRAELRRDGRNNEPVNAISWLCWNAPCAGERMFYVSDGQLRARKGPYVQGHYGQLLAILAQSKVKPDYQIVADGKTFAVTDLIESEKKTCRSGEELTFKLIGLAHYLDLNAKWKSETGQEWDIPRLIKEEVAQPINGAPCGGTHRLMGLSYAVHKRQQRGEPIDGEYARAASYVRDYQKYTLAMQNPDGSFSTEWFRRRADRTDAVRKLQTTGHILEWLVFSLPDDRLDDPRVVKAVTFLTSLLEEGGGRQWEIGPLGHGIHALAIYRERKFGPITAQTTPELAQGQTPAAH